MPPVSASLQILQHAIAALQPVLALDQATLSRAVSRDDLGPLTEVASLVASDSNPTDPFCAQAACQLSSQLFLLLGRLLAAHPKPSDWTAAYCRSLSAVLAASRAICCVNAGLRAAVATGISSDTLSRLAAAQVEIKHTLNMQLLLPRAMSRELGQLPTQRSSKKLLRKDKKQQQRLQQQEALLDAAQSLLSWCAAARWLWSSRDPNSSSTSSSFALRSVELAATAARCPLRLRSIGTAAETLPPALPSMCTAVHGVADRAFLLLAKARPKGSNALREQLLCSTACMQLCLALLLPVCTLLQQQAGASSSSISSGSGQSVAAGSKLRASQQPSPPLGAAKAQQVGATSSAAAMQQQQQQQQQQSNAAAGQHSNQLAVPQGVLQLWETQFPSEDLPAWIDAVRSMEGTGTLLQGSCTPSTHPGGGSSDSSSSSSSSGGGSSTGATLPAAGVFKQLPGDAHHLLQAFVMLAQVFAQCVQMWAHGEAAVGRAKRTTAQSRDRGSGCSLAQQGLLQEVVWQAPQLLLQTALLCGGGEPLVTEVAADAAWYCIDCWKLPDIQLGLPSGGGSSAAEHQQQAWGQLVPPLLDCWLQLMQQQLLQPGSGLLHAAAAAAANCHQQPQQSQGLPGSAAEVGSAAGGLPQPQSLCQCCPVANSVAVLVQPNAPCVRFECSRCYSVSVLIHVLTALAVANSISASSSRLPSVLLLLEVVLRRVGPLRACCSCSGSSGDGALASSSSDSKLSSGALHMLSSCHSAFERLMKPGLCPHVPAAVKSVFAVAATWSKVCRCPGTLFDTFDSWQLAAGYQLGMLSGMQAVACTQVQACSSLGAVRAALAPWVVLLGQFLHHMSAQLQQSVMAAPTAPAGVIAQAEGPAGASCSEPDSAVAAVPQTPLASRWQLLLASSIQQTRDLLLLLGQKWQGAGEFAGSGDTVQGHSEGTASGEQQQQQEVASSSGMSPAVYAAAPAAYWLQHCSLAAEFASLAGSTLAAPDAASLTLPVGFAAALQQVGAALCAKLPVPWLCNNPGCTSLAGASELQLVGGKACVCGGCRVARYCSRSCQAAHRAQHSTACTLIAACAGEAEAAAAAQASTSCG